MDKSLLKALIIHYVYNSLLKQKILNKEIKSLKQFRYYLEINRFKVILNFLLA